MMADDRFDPQALARHRAAGLRERSRIARAAVAALRRKAAALWRRGLSGVARRPADGGRGGMGPAAP